MRKKRSKQRFGKQNSLKRKVIKKEKQGKGNRYCLECNHCHKTFYLMGKRYNRGEGYYCSISCGNKGERRRFIGRKKLKRGYIGIYVPNDKRADKQGYYPEHRLIMEKHLGRKIRNDEFVHHKNKRPDDNRMENLELISPSNHSKLHHPKTGKVINCSCCNKKTYKNNYQLIKFKNQYCSVKCYLLNRWNYQYA